MLYYTSTLYHTLLYNAILHKYTIPHTTLQCYPTHVSYAMLRAIYYCMHTINYNQCWFFQDSQAVGRRIVTYDDCFFDGGGLGPGKHKPKRVGWNVWEAYCWISTLNIQLANAVFHCYRNAKTKRYPLLLAQCLPAASRHELGVGGYGIMLAVWQHCSKSTPSDLLPIYLYSWQFAQNLDWTMIKVNHNVVGHFQIRVSKWTWNTC